MHKKLESELISIAHSILKMKNKEDVFALKEQSKQIYEKLTMLAFVEEYINTTPNAEESREELLQAVSTAFDDKEKVLDDVLINEEVSGKPTLSHEKDHKDKEDIIVEEKEEVAILNEPEAIEEESYSDEKEEVQEIIEQPFDDLEALMFETLNEENQLVQEDKELNLNEQKTLSLEDELQDTISVDVMADLFDNVQPKSLNDKLNTNIQIGLNDRIAFVKHLFNNQQEDYNRVISQLNTFKIEKEAKSFIHTMVKPDYNWTDQEELEARFLEIITRRFS
ncbi:hypothetical protein [Polaribacter sp.]|uniref:hypothetical protein n=1 Tax=Polaribacter sp. TaxID=1920175 RepID=UPI0025FF0FE9|nr:hypothetical protein [Polaribacter sp.]